MNNEYLKQELTSLKKENEQLKKQILKLEQENQKLKRQQKKSINQILEEVS